jgi:predicted dehydrogenase
MSNGIRVGVIGASGIGQHHARWHTLCGSDVVAFVGSSDASVARTRQRLIEYFGFSGKGYTSVSDMLSQEAPDIVVVASSYALHHLHAMEAIAAGAHVLCEKPLVWDEALSLDHILAEGEEIAAAAHRSSRLFEMTAQYPACLPLYRELYALVEGEMASVEKIEMEMEVKRRGERKLFESNWIDVASHPISLIVALLGKGEIVEGSALCEVEEAECCASFTFVGDKGTADCSFTIRDIEDGTPVRRFGVNGFLAEWDGFADSAGIYRATLTHGDHVVSGDDFLHTMIQSFTQSVLDGRDDILLGADDALLNLELQVDLLRLARTGASAA